MTARTRKVAGAAVALLVVAAALTWWFGLRDDSDGAAQLPPTRSERSTIEDRAFPERIRVKITVPVEWRNDDDVAHTVTSDTGLFDSGEIAPGRRFAFALSRTGTFGYHCEIHPTMRGVVVVEE